MNKLREIAFATSLSLAAGTSACNIDANYGVITPENLRAKNEGYAEVSREFLWSILSQCPINSNNMPVSGERKIGERYSNCVDVNGDDAVDAIVVHTKLDKYCYIDDQNSPHVGVIRGALCNLLEKS